MAYGIADTLSLSQTLGVFDLALPSFPYKNDAIFAIFGNAKASSGSNLLTKFLSDAFSPTFEKELKSSLYNPNPGETSEGVPDALRRTFLTLNGLAYHHLLDTSRKNPHLVADGHDPLKAGASGVVLYIHDRTLFLANVGSSLAVVSRGGRAVVLSVKHDSLDRGEIERIRAAEGWISPRGLVNDATDVSRSFGYFDQVPVVNARPDIFTHDVTEQDEFLILGNNGFWEFISTQTAVDMARSEWADPMIAAQKLRDFAISYGARGSSMVMVVSLSSAFKPRPRQATIESLGAVGDSDLGSPLRWKRKEDMLEPTILEDVTPPVGHLALVFTELKHSDYLWESNPGMPEAARTHHEILRRELHACGGYEVKREFDTFMVAFETVSAALLWCLKVQVELMDADWPREILEWEGGREVRGWDGQIVGRGLSVMMGIHCGAPLCEPDAITKRMDYFGPMVNRSARVTSAADGGQIMVSADVASEIRATVLGDGPETEYSTYQPTHIVDAVKKIGIYLVPKGEVKMKGLEVPETLSLVYPKRLVGRHETPIIPEESESEETMEEEVDPQSVQYLRDLSQDCARLEDMASQKLRGSSLATATLASSDIGQTTASSHPTQNFTHIPPAIPDKPCKDQISSGIDFALLRIANAASVLNEPAAAIPSLSDSAKIMAAFGGRMGQPLGPEKLRRLLELLES